MADFTQLTKKGMAGYWIQSSLPEGCLSLHVSELPSGARPHGLHTHEGVEAFYVMEGKGELEFEDGSSIPLGKNQGVAVDATQPHTLFNSGTEPMKYVVVVSKP